ncbi:Mlp family lipoprotein [Borreliella burgdorferi]|uniref:Mlp family lipoprotein n=1 Tax=Borreliella burgdorferi TaxID=139 RepID=UPI001E5F1437|nr:Mlp family lipoprotein [Borreliella burgdorferi]MCD2385101.1 Mlp family lipoprotein [Borreliella burgdorferi]MCD2393630.1 Mlp family lipoprotein [Borreliella burgdorferi]
MKIINILFCLLLLVLNSCNANANDTFNNNSVQQAESRKKRDLSQEELPQQEKITLTSDEEKMFNSLINVFKYTIEKLNNEIQGCMNGNKSKCNDFFDWLSEDIQKQKELADAFTKVYNFLKSKAQNETFDTYIKGAIDCKKNTLQDCNNNNKYGNGSNDIEQYFRGVANDMSNRNSNEEIYQYLKDELLKEDNHYAGLTANWQN